MARLEVILNGGKGNLLKLDADQVDLGEAFVTIWLDEKRRHSISYPTAIIDAVEIKQREDTSV